MKHMTTNPYESPETVSNPPPPSKSNFPKLALRLLVWGGIFLLLLALLLPNVRSAREPARRMQCSNHLKQIGLALQNYHDDYQSFPPAYIADASGKPIHSWRVLILPYMEQKALYDKYSFDEPWDGPHNSKLRTESIAAFCCPSQTGQHPQTDTSYVAVIGAQTAWPAEESSDMKSITDGTSNTILVVEIANSGIHWMEPRDLHFDQIPLAVNPKNGTGISSAHPNVAMVVFADGHTAALTYNTPSDILRRLLTIADGEPIGEF
jgi:prepilin-type processing-associated H-X9-DG protein